MDKALIEKHLVHIVESVDLLQARARPAELVTDPVQYGFVLHTLQTAVQSAIDVAAMVVAGRHLGEPSTNRELFSKLAVDGWLGASQVEGWRRIVAFRNIVVHRYLQVDPEVVRSILTQRLPDLLEFVRNVRDRLQAMP